MFTLAIVVILGWFLASIIGTVAYFKAESDTSIG